MFSQPELGTNEPMSIVVDRGKWEVSCDRLPPRHHNSDKQTAIREVMLMPCFALVSSRSVMHLHMADLRVMHC
jgi:hypothetical protein